jgi:hypothetical protein
LDLPTGARIEDVACQEGRHLTGDPLDRPLPPLFAEGIGHLLGDRRQGVAAKLERQAVLAAGESSQTLPLPRAARRTETLSRQVKTGDTTLLFNRALFKFNARHLEFQEFR